ncbi:unnamed protein product [Didymodactylos carnosus]|uniref:Uncharacterized protein n=1 Tax=Didymodactylos carnosus TaxID=1234261 RepID=A0A813NJR1_9BILA|nr:unnamed protein product [Didymodactylos carnosus]CAF0839098.1 unnamed protein product [Didymodactylos carnosus]CAF3514659.1 unnamed protein product [Didymodactylos carnosus]CAF3623955.1 unnamed protein product [Didymodactylos carnosus]
MRRKRQLPPVLQVLGTPTLTDIIRSKNTEMEILPSEYALQNSIDTSNSVVSTLSEPNKSKVVRALDPEDSRRTIVNDDDMLLAYLGNSNVMLNNNEDNQQGYSNQMNLLNPVNPSSMASIYSARILDTNERQRYIKQLQKQYEQNEHFNNPRQGVMLSPQLYHINDQPVITDTYTINTVQNHDLPYTGQFETTMFKHRFNPNIMKKMHVEGSQQQSQPQTSPIFRLESIQQEKPISLLFSKNEQQHQPLLTTFHSPTLITNVSLELSNNLKSIINGKNIQVVELANGWKALQGEQSKKNTSILPDAKLPIEILSFNNSIFSDDLMQIIRHTNPENISNMMNINNISTDQLHKILSDEPSTFASKIVSHFNEQQLELLIQTLTNILSGKPTYHTKPDNSSLAHFMTYVDSSDTYHTSGTNNSSSSNVSVMSNLTNIVSELYKLQSVNANWNSTPFSQQQQSSHRYWPLITKITARLPRLGLNIVGRMNLTVHHDSTLRSLSPVSSEIPTRITKTTTIETTTTTISTISSTINTQISITNELTETIKPTFTPTSTIPPVNTIFEISSTITTIPPTDAAADGNYDVRTNKNDYLMKLLKSNSTNGNNSRPLQTIVIVFQSNSNLSPKNVSFDTLKMLLDHLSHLFYKNNKKRTIRAIYNESDILTSHNDK